MSTLTNTALPTVPSAVTPTTVAGSDVRLSFGRTVRSEFIKSSTLRSTWWILGLTAALCALFALGFAGQTMNAIPSVTKLLMGAPVGLLAASVFGALTVAGDYSSGMMRATLTATPRRTHLVLAKAIVAATFTTVAMAVSFTASLVLGTSQLPEPIDWSRPTASTYPILLGLVCTAAFAVLGVGFGFLVRHGAGAVGVTLGVLAGVPLMALLVSASGGVGAVSPALLSFPLTAAGGMVTADPGDLTWPAIALAVWTAAIFAAGWSVFRKRDA